MIASRKSKESIGVMDRRITIQKPVVTRSATGSETVTWVDAADVWAMIEWRTLSNEEKSTGGYDLPTQSLAITIRYIADITPKWRILYRNSIYDIIFIEEQGRMNRQVLRCIERIEG